ncbi:MAG: restriction endonuclease, partial [Clostridia bacterium]|nr:restriction endonuclease [Clostridia bacterium]
MIDKGKLQEVLEAYKRDFPYMWEDTYEGIKCGGEKYKWEAVKKFQEVFPKDLQDLQSYDGDFADMLERALKPTGNILDSGYVYSRARILMFAKADAKRVRNMFVSLYDEGKDLIGRIVAFKAEADQMLTLYGGDYKEHDQDEHAIMVYLWLRYPDKYFVYRYGEARTMAKFLWPECVIKKSSKKDISEDNIRNYIKLYDKVRDYIAQDYGLTSL